MLGGKEEIHTCTYQKSHLWETNPYAGGVATSRQWLVYLGPRVHSCLFLPLWPTSPTYNSAL